MVYLVCEQVKVNQYASSNNNDGTKKVSSGRIDLGEIGEPLIGKPVFVAVRPKKGTEFTCITTVKSIKWRKYKVPYVSAMFLKDMVGEEVDADIIEIE